MIHSSIIDYQSFLTTRFILECLSSERLLPVRKAKREAFSKLVSALSGSLKPSYYLSSLDPGMGKSKLIMDFLRLWKSCDFKPEGSVLICLSRLDEIDRFIQECALSTADYAVLVGKPGYSHYGLGRDKAGQAKVLFTTQQMIAKRCHGRNFTDVEEFHFNGRPRTCRIWDESLNPYKEVAIPVDQIAALPAILRLGFHEPIAALDPLIAAINRTQIGEQVHVPHDVSSAFASHLPFKVVGELNLSAEVKNTILTLADVGGITLTKEQGSKGQMALIGAVRSLPDDFMPAIIFDASGRVRQTYALAEQHLANIIRLPAVPTDFSRLTINVWNHPMGSDKRADPNHRAVVVKVAADLINAEAEENWLVLHHLVDKPGDKLAIGAKRPDIPAELRSLLKNPRNVKFLHWGIHQASNDYRDIKRVIVLGLWRKPSFAYRALGMASGMGYGSLGDDECKAVRLGEHMHELLQGIGRCNVRNVDQGIGGEAEVYLVTHGGAELDRILRDTFPNSTIHPWQPVDGRLIGHHKAVTDYVIAAFSNPSLRSLAKQSVQIAVGISSSHGLSNVLRDDRVTRRLALHGITKKGRCFVRAGSLPVCGFT